MITGTLPGCGTIEAWPKCGPERAGSPTACY